MRSTFALFATLSLTTFVSAQNFATYSGTKSASGSYDINPGKTYTATSLSQCQTYCANEPSCYLASWDKQHNQCYLCSGTSCYKSTPLEAGHGSYWFTSILGTCSTTRAFTATVYNQAGTISLSDSSLTCADSTTPPDWAIYKGYMSSSAPSQASYAKASASDCRTICDATAGCACAQWDGQSLCTLFTAYQCATQFSSGSTLPSVQQSVNSTFMALDTSCSRGVRTTDNSNAVCADNFDPCPAGQYGSLGNCQACPLGTNSTLATYSSTSCTACPPGSGGQSAGGFSTCQPCPPGTYSAQSNGTCIAVPPFSVSLANGTGYTACAPNQYVVNNACTQCPAGQAPSTSTSCASCASGFYGTDGSCSACPTGSTTSTTSDHQSCDSCANGYYRNGTICSTCPLGYDAPAGATSIDQCKPCPFGTYSDGGSCNPCNPGMYTQQMASTNSSQCLPADFGFYTDTEGTLLDCPAGSNTTALGATSITQCQCGLGQFMNSSNVCQTCASYAPAYANWTTPAIGATYMNNTCSPCPAGQFLAADMTCTSCSSNQTSLSGSASCVDKVCGPRMFANGTVTQCLPDVGQVCSFNSYEYLLGTTECYSGFCANGLCADSASLSNTFDGLTIGSPVILASHTGGIQAGSLEARGAPLQLLVDPSSSGGIAVTSVKTIPEKSMKFPPVNISAPGSVSISGTQKSISSAGDFLVSSLGFFQSAANTIFVTGNMAISASYISFSTPPDVFAQFATFYTKKVQDFRKRTYIETPIEMSSFTGTLGYTNTNLRVFGGNVTVHGCQTTYKGPETTTCSSALISIHETNEITIYSGNVQINTGTFATYYGGTVNNNQGTIYAMVPFHNAGSFTKRDGSLMRRGGSSCSASNNVTSSGGSSNTQCGPGLSPDGNGGCLVNDGGACSCNSDCLHNNCNPGDGQSPPDGTCMPASTSAPNSRKARRARMASRFGPRSHDDRCPAPLSACGVAGSLSGGFECVNLLEELESCGACGNSCYDIPGAQGVACSEGACVISSCAPGLLLRNNECVDRYD